MTRQFFKGSGPLGPFFEKTKTPFLRYGVGECVYQISALYLFSLCPKGDVQTNRPIYLQVKIGISSTGCSPHVNFDNLGPVNPRPLFLHGISIFQYDRFYG